MTGYRDILAQALSQHRAGRLDEAAIVYRALLAERPDDPECLSLLGAIALARGDFERAMTLAARALACQPGFAPARSNLAVALHKLGRLDEAVVQARAALSLTPGEADLYYNFGNILRQKTCPGDAAIAQGRAVHLCPDHAKAWHALGLAQMDQGRVEDGLSAIQSVMALCPDEPYAHLALSEALFHLGRPAEGWERYEHRHRLSHVAGLGRTWPQPVWTGDPLAGRRLLVHWEQGFGDILQFARYVPLISGGEVIFQVRDGMAGLLRTMSNAPLIVEESQALPSFDCRVSLLSLPRLFWAGHGAVTAAPPYLHPPPSTDWQRRIAAGATMTVGLCWAGRSSHADDFKRSMSLERLRPLMDIPGLRLFSLQIDPPDCGPKALPECVTDLGPKLESFLDTAQAITALDLVITVDTALAHLAGALGRPVWVMLAKAPDWRWGMEGERTPWYPSMRLFRQSCAGDWSEVIGRISAALRRGQASSRRAT